MLLIIVAVCAFAPTTWTLVAGGDVMFYAMDPKRESVAAIAPVFAQADVAYANLEVPLTAHRIPTPRKSAEDRKARRQFVLKADPRHIASLTRMGLDLVSLGNNHAMDYGIEGLRATRAGLRKAGIGATGAGENLADAEAVVVKVLPSGLRVGLVSYLAFMGSGAMAKCTPASIKSPGVATLAFGGVINDRARLRLAQVVDSARQRADVVLVALHWGIERDTRPTAYQVALGRAFIDAGADGVLGAHPHTLQGREVYAGRPILYSLGNLISPLPAASAVVTLRWRGRKFLSAEVRPMLNRGGRAVWPKPVEEAKARRAVTALNALIPPGPARRITR